MKAARVIWILLFFSGIVHAQPFAAEIAAFKKADSINIPFAGKHPIVFAGSSSFRMWTKMQEAFPGYPIINRGFGGSTLTDLIRYTNEIIIPYAPKQGVIYSGDNDLVSSDTVTAKEVFKRFRKLYHLIINELPYASIVYISLKPSRSRKHLQSKMEDANKMIAAFLHKKKRTKYVDVYHAMLNVDGTIKRDIFLADSLHINDKGYAIWQRLIAPVLIK